MTRALLSDDPIAQAADTAVRGHVFGSLPAPTWKDRAHLEAVAASACAMARDEHVRADAAEARVKTLETELADARRTIAVRERMLAQQDDALALARGRCGLCKAMNPDGLVGPYVLDAEKAQRLRDALARQDATRARVEAEVYPHVIDGVRRTFEEATQAIEFRMPGDDAELGPVCVEAPRAPGGR